MFTFDQARGVLGTEPFNALVFLTYKPAGRASPGGRHRARLAARRFMQFLAAPQRRTALQLGVDACLSPLLLRRGNLDGTFFGSCEAGFLLPLHGRGIERDALLLLQ